MSQHANFEHPVELLKSLHQRYSSFHSYFNSKKINYIIEQKRQPFVLAYEDIQYLVEDEENLKRYYRNVQYNSKLTTFKQYYFYHEDCPRIFQSNIEIIYAKWQDRRRNLIYKKLKRLFDQTSGEQTQNEDEQSVVTHPNLLFQISEYNPFSKKYYIRVQQKGIKEKQRKAKQKQKIKTKDEISRLKHDLSEMLGDIKDLSVISTLDSARMQPKMKIYHRKAGQHLNSQGSQQHSNSKSHSSIKFNFKRKKDSQKLIINKEKDPALKIDSKQKFKSKQLSGDITPKKLPHPNGPNEKDSLQKYKSKSIFSTTAFRSLNCKDDTEINPKRQLLKINLQSKHTRIASTNSKQQNNKINQYAVQSVENNKVRFIKSQSTQKLQFMNNVYKIQVKESQLKKLKTKPDDFGDFKLNLLHKNEPKLGSYKSQQTSQKKLEGKNSHRRSNSKKTSFKIKEVQGQKDKRGMLKL